MNNTERKNAFQATAMSRIGQAQMIAAELSKLIDIDADAGTSPRWTAKIERPYVWPVLTDVDGRRFMIRTDGNRLAIHGDYPRFADERYAATPYHGDQKRPSITVSADRPATTIAAEIKRRFLPDFRTYWVMIAERVRLHDTFDAAIKTLRTELAAMIEGATIRKDSDRGMWTPSPYHVVNINAPDSVEVHVRGDHVLGQRLIETVERWRREYTCENCGDTHPACSQCGKPTRCPTDETGQPFSVCDECDHEHA